MKRFSLRARLIFNFSLAILICIILFVFYGRRMIGDMIIKQAQEKVRLDLNSAREIYHNEISGIRYAIRLSAARFFFKDALLARDRKKLFPELEKIRVGEALDILNLTDREGNILVRSRSPLHSDGVLKRQVVDWVIAKGTVTEAAEILSEAELLAEGNDLAAQARIKLPFPAYKHPWDDAAAASGLVISAAAPIYDYNENLIGVLYGAKLINHNYEIVDRVKRIVFKNEKYKGKEVGTVTIFQDGLRISTNVKNNDGSRAVGTWVSKEVYSQVVGKGIPWTDRAFVVNDWYITAYEPIKNLAGEIIGMLYVGNLEAPYIDLKNRVLLNFLAIALVSIILLAFISYFTATRTTKPLKELTIATKEVASGNLSHRVHIESRDEIGQLADSFNRMTIDLENLTRNYQILNRTLEDKVKDKTRELQDTQDQLVQSEKLSSLGRMAAGVAHEINNPLTSILINAHLLAEEIGSEAQYRENLTLIIEETTRCSTIVKNLLQFSRQTKAVKELADINEVIDRALFLLKNQFLIQNVKVTKNLAADLPKIIIDRGKIGQVFTNIIMNSLDAMSAAPGNGELSVQSYFLEEEKRIEIIFRDNGCGIAEKNMGKIFDPFFTTKGIKGTGLGLSVSYGIVQQHGGKIEIQSEEGKGTTVIISIRLN
jgi:two-component system NtrC family sensor kinase